MDYVAFLQTAWHYFPYLFYAFVLLTFLPKSVRKIKDFADADYAANRNKYHRCYAPDACCHTQPKPKPRKAVTRVYPKKQAAAVPEQDTAAPLKRPVVAATLLAQHHVNDLAKMFESGSASRKVNRVPPTMIPEQRTQSAASIDDVGNNKQETHNTLQPAVELDTNWCSEPIAIPQQRQHQRQVPTTLSFSDGASATPSSGSPTASTYSPAPSASPSPLSEFAPTLRRVPLNLQSSLEDIFAAIARNAESGVGGECSLKFAGCNSLSPVTSIDDILAQRRLSRPLSAYSISDLLQDESNQGMDGAFVESFLRTLNKA